MTAKATRAVPVDLLAHLRRARDHIDRHYQQPLDVALLARVAGVSRYHFIRCFEAAYGDTPIRYLTRRRIERAQDLLRLANLTVTEVCMAVGFASLGSFSTRFAQLVGETPTAYRNRWAALGGPRVPGCYLFMRGALDPAGTATPAPPATAPPAMVPPATVPAATVPAATVPAADPGPPGPGDVGSRTLGEAGPATAGVAS